jgi:hypothetical protein
MWPAHGRALSLLVMTSDAPSRSTFVTVVAWVFIVLSAFTSVIALMQNVMVWMMDLPRHSVGEGPAEWLFGNVKFLFLGYLAASIGTLGVSIGLLHRRSWARVMFIAILALGIAWFVITVPLQWILVPSMPGPEMASFRMMQMVIRAFTTVFAVGMAGLFGWLIKRLLSPALREEFRAA